MQTGIYFLESNIPSTYQAVYKCFCTDTEGAVEINLFWIQMYNKLDVDEKKTILVRHRGITPPGFQRVNSMKETSHICARSRQKSVRGRNCPQMQSGRREDRPLMQKQLVYQARRGTLTHVARFLHEAVSSLTFKV